MGKQEREGILPVSEDLLLASFLTEYVRVFLVDLEEDSICLLLDREPDREVETLLEESAGYADFNRRCSRTFPDEEFRAWREQALSRENIRRTLRSRKNYSIAYPLRRGSRWRKLQVRLLQEESGIPVRILLCQPGPESEGQSAYRGAAFYDAAGVFEVNVTRNRVLSGTVSYTDVFYYVPGIDIPGPFDLHVRSWRDRLVVPAEREAFTRLVDRDGLLDAFARGEQELEISYKVLDRTENPVFLRETILLSQEESSGDLVALIVMRDITAQRQVEEENRRRMRLIGALTIDYTTVYFVNLETDTYEIYRRDGRVMDRFSECFVPSFSESVVAFARRGVVAEDRAVFVESLRADVLRRELERKYLHSFLFRADTSVGPAHHRAKIVRIGSLERPLVEVVIGFADISEEQRIEDQRRKVLENALELARNADRAKSLFLTNMSHDIRTPMNAILGFTHIALGHLEEKARVRDCLDKILDSGDHLMELINNVLDMSRIESGRMELHEIDCSLRDTVSYVQDALLPMIHEKGQALTVVDDPLAAMAYRYDPLVMRQLLLNILNNAIKFTGEGGNIFLEIAEEDNAPRGYATVRITVRDDGIGMSPEFVNRLFDPFEREMASTVGNVPGNGLGMSICKGIVEAMGGTIDVSSRQGIGTEVAIRLPLRLQEAARQAEDTERRQALEEKARRRRQKIFDTRDLFVELVPEGKRILVVEDNVLNMEIACDLLEEAGFDMERAVNGQVAVDMVASAPPGYYDAILMDVQMPVMDGYEATRAIRAMGDMGRASTPIVAMTANVFEEDMRKCLEVGMDAFIGKPMELDKVIRTLTPVLHAHGRIQA